MDAEEEQGVKRECFWTSQKVEESHLFQLKSGGLISGSLVRTTDKRIFASLVSLPFV